MLRKQMNIAALYIAASGRLPWTKAQLRPYVVHDYVDEETPSSWMFDTFVWWVGKYLNQEIMCAKGMRYLLVYLCYILIAVTSTAEVVVVDNFKYSLSGSGATLVGGCVECPDDSTLIVPGHFHYNGVDYTVNALSFFGSYEDGSTKLAHIVLPETVTKIEESFYGCPNLKELIVPEGVVKLLETSRNYLQLPSTLKPSEFYSFDSRGHQQPALWYQNQVFWNLPFSALTMALIEQNTYNNQHPELFLAMTTDCSGKWSTSKYPMVRGFGLWGKDITPASSGVVAVPVEFNRVDPVNELHCYIDLPVDVQLSSENIILNPARIVDHQLEYAAGMLSISSPSGAALQGFSGDLFTMSLPEGTSGCDIVLRDISMKTIYGKSIVQEDDTIRVLGGRVDIADVNKVINLMLGKGRLESLSVDDTRFDMVYVDGGTFMMGVDGEYEDFENIYDDVLSPQHQVTVNDFYISKTEVTNRLWDAVMGTQGNISYSTFPVTGKSWNQWQTFIQKLNELTGFVFRMPTEAEWDFAARGGNKTHGYSHSGSDTASEVGWCYNDTQNEDSTPFPVACKKPNELGLYDMSGNVWEWCSDWYDAYPSTAQENPQGPLSGSKRVIRGGSFMNLLPERTSVNNRAGLEPASSVYNSFMGFAEPVGMRLAASVQSVAYNPQYDYNNDGVVDIADVNAVINQMLGKGYDVPTGHQGHDTAPDY